MRLERFFFFLADRAVHLTSRAISRGFQKSQCVFTTSSFNFGVHSIVRQTRDEETRSKTVSAVTRDLRLIVHCSNAVTPAPFYVRCFSARGWRSRECLAPLRAFFLSATRLACFLLMVLRSLLDDSRVLIGEGSAVPFLFLVGLIPQRRLFSHMYTSISAPLLVLGGQPC